jgi:L,D-peptidoglycan transpeptidase YkuD (ErfK/YbiS/YcfS/YnhG family)
MLCIERRSGTWIPARDPFEVIVGSNGMAWGIGLHERDSDGPLKKEGDSKAPAGIFHVVKAMGYAASPPNGTTFPYEQIRTASHCIDDPASQYYNQIVDASDLKKPVADFWKSSEIMNRRDDLYKWLIVVDHNVKDPKPGAGSCIFIHIWRSKDRGTAGCTAMAEKNIVALLTWLKPEDKPLFVQLPKMEYERLWKEWNLPAPEFVNK